ncbi:MAG: GNAT family N-acetyltransferase [Caldilineaceae bacterium]|nr:GNAT family N-acetyltransferase [Caldilineaceae bacterium]
MHIRPARIDDALGMAHVIVDAFLLANEGIMPEEALQKRRQEWTYEVSARAWEKTLRELDEGSEPDSCIYVAVEQGDGEGSEEIVGLAYGSPTATGGKGVGEVDVLYVRADRQGQGIGRALVQAVAAFLAQHGMPTLYIAALEASPAARGFYEALGGQWIGTRDDYDEGILIPLVVYAWLDTQALIAERR